MGFLSTTELAAAHAVARKLMLEIRPDRIATLYFFHPLQRLLRRASAGIPILMYHSISERPRRHRDAYFHTCTRPQVFREHVGLLARNGYKTIDLDEAVRRLKSRPARPKSWWF